MATYDFVMGDLSQSVQPSCSGATSGDTTLSRRMQVGGTAGTSVTPDPGSGYSDAIRYCLEWRSGPGFLGLTTWDAGDWVIPLNITACDAGTIIREVWVCDYTVSSGSATVASTSSPGHSRGGTGLLTVTINRATDYTVLDSAASVIYIIVTMSNNDAHGASSITIDNDRTINSPIVIPAAGDAPYLEPMGVIRSWS